MIKFEIKTDIHGRCAIDCELNSDYYGCQLQIQIEERDVLTNDRFFIPGKECPFHQMSNATGVYSIYFRREEGD